MAFTMLLKFEMGSDLYASIDSWEIETQELLRNHATKMNFTKFLSIFLVTALFAALVPIADPASGQMSANPPEIGAKIRAMGAKLNRDVIVSTVNLYSPLLRDAPTEAVKITPDQPFGSHERHRLDVYQPVAQSSELAPIVVFLHGGGFVRGDKSQSRNIGAYFARHGIVSIIANYRLAPNGKWPSGAEDIAAIIKWIKSKSAKFGGDGSKIFLMGNSAGTSHVATYVFLERFQVENDGVVGAILVSGPTFDLSLNVTPSGELGHPGERSYFGADSSRYDDMSVINNVGGRKIPLFIAYAELDPPLIQRQNKILIDAIRNRDNLMPTIKQVADHNHISIVLHFNTKDESLGPDLLEFINSQ